MVPRRRWFFESCKRYFSIEFTKEIQKSFIDLFFQFIAQHVHYNVAARANKNISKCRIHLSCLPNVFTKFNRWTWTFANCVSISILLCNSRQYQRLPKKEFRNAKPTRSPSPDWNCVEWIRISIVWQRNRSCTRWNFVIDPQIRISLQFTFRFLWAVTVAIKSSNWNWKSVTERKIRR